MNGKTRQTGLWILLWAAMGLWAACTPPTAKGVWPCEGDGDCRKGWFCHLLSAGDPAAIGRFQGICVQAADGAELAPELLNPLPDSDAEPSDRPDLRVEIIDAEDLEMTVIPDHEVLPPSADVDSDDQPPDWCPGPCCEDRDCNQADECGASRCDPIAHECVPPIEGTPCDLSERQGGWLGACEAGVCIHLVHPLPGLQPGDSPWTPATSEPVAAPAGCQDPCGKPGTDLPCNSGSPTFIWPPDTGQTDCYNASQSISCLGTAGDDDCTSIAFCGQDAQYGWDASNSAWDENRFVVAGTTPNAIVTDTWTGLVWQLHYIEGKTWEDALQHCREEADDDIGRSAWRLPDRFELQSLINYGRSKPAYDFPGMPPDTWLWSSSSYVDVRNPGTSWVVGSGYGYVGHGENGMQNAVRCVSRSARMARQRFFRRQATADQSVVFDSRTGLLWQGNIENEDRNLTWPQALERCEDIHFGGRSDWRLPNVLELASVVDAARFNQAVDSLAFPNTWESYFWSSSTYLGLLGKAWHVHFGSGYVDFDEKDGFLSAARCVALGPQSSVL